MGGCISCRGICSSLHAVAAAKTAVNEAKIGVEEAQKARDRASTAKEVATRAELEANTALNKFGQTNSVIPNSFNTQKFTDYFEMKLLKNNSFIQFGKIPRSTDMNTDDYVTLRDISQNRGNSFVVFISHCWWSSTHPDPSGQKYKTLVKALVDLKVRIGSSVELYIWLDFFSIDQDNDENKSKGIASLPYYISNSDCLISPFSDVEPTSFSSTREPGPLDECWNFYKERRCFSNDPKHYFGRAWCRLEMYLASNIPVDKNGYGYFQRLGLKRGGRPHFISCDFDFMLRAMPEICGPWSEKLNPVKGALTDENDRKKLQDIMNKCPATQKYFGYFGEKLEQGLDGQPCGHGLGVEFYQVDQNPFDIPFTSSFAGQFTHGKPHGFGVLEEYNGTIYQGHFTNGSFGDIGITKTAEGVIYAGDWQWGQGCKSWSYCVKDDGCGGKFEKRQVKIGKSKSHYECGCFISEKNDKWEGKWNHSQNIAFGIFHFSNTAPKWERWEGKWNDTWHCQNLQGRGVGVCHLRNGGRWEGGWDCRELDGPGIMYYPNGLVFVEEYEKGECIRKASRIPALCWKT